MQILGLKGLHYCPTPKRVGPLACRDNRVDATYRNSIIIPRGSRARRATYITTVLSDIARTGASDRLRHVTQHARAYTCTRGSVLANPTWCACGLPTESRWEPTQAEGDDGAWAATPKPRDAPWRVFACFFRWSSTVLSSNRSTTFGSSFVPRKDVSSVFPAKSNYETLSGG